MEALLTIGYEKADPNDFVATLAVNGVDLLIDVRERAMSRRKGFAKTALRDNLLAANISYRHEPKLGSPSDLRNALRRDGDYPTFFRAYDAHLSDQSALLDELAALPGMIVLLCYERLPGECHRSSVARELSDRTKLDVQHLGVRSGLHAEDRKYTRACFGQSLSTA